MINVGYIALSDDGSSYYRCQGVFPFLIDKRVNFHDISKENLHSWVTYLSYSIIIIQRPFAQDHLNIIDLVQLMGKKVICDYDDDVLNVPIHNPAHELYQEHRQKVMQCIRQANEVWVSTKGIKKSFERLSNNIHVIPNGHNDFLFPVKNKMPFNSGNKTVFYRGGATHQLDLKLYANDICRIASENKSWDFYFLGEYYNYQFQHTAEANDNINVCSHIPLMQYFNHLYSLNPTIMIAPLQDTLLNQSKSNISFIEATYAGAAFFGNKKLPEFNKDFIFPLSLLGKAISENHVATLRENNETSWVYIKENLLLSDINKLRLERILL